MWDWMEAHHLNQRQFAKVLGLSYGTLNRYLRARRLTPSRDHMEWIFVATGISKALWLETRVGKSRKTRKAKPTKRSAFQSGNAHVA